MLCHAAALASVLRVSSNLVTIPISILNHKIEASSWGSHQTSQTVGQKFYSFLSLPKEDPRIGRFPSSQAAPHWEEERPEYERCPKHSCHFQWHFYWLNILLGPMTSQLFIEYSQWYSSQYIAINSVPLWGNKGLQLSLLPSCWCYLHQLFLEKGKKAIQWRKHNLFIKLFGIIGFPHATKWIFTILHTTCANLQTGLQAKL